MSGIGYCRRSIEDEKSHSIEYQVSAIEKLAKSHSISLVSIEIDNGVSGKSTKNRPGLQKVIKAVREGLVQSVLVFKSDRISRNGIESIGIEKLFRDHEIRYLSVTEGILSGNSIEDSFMSFLRGGLNERERLLQSCRVKFALQKKREKNERLGSQPRYGYYVQDHQLIENPVEQSLVARVKELRSSGLTTRKIAQQLSNEGYRTRKNTNFSQTQICRILAT